MTFTTNDARQDYGGGAANLTENNNNDNLFALICGPFCKGTPFEELLGLNDTSNNKNANTNNHNNGTDIPLITNQPDGGNNLPPVEIYAKKTIFFLNFLYFLLIL